MKKPKKSIRIILGVVALVVVIALLAISIYSKLLIERFDKRYIGREIKMDLSFVNPLTGFIYFSNIKIYENESDSVFFSAKGVSLNVSMFKLFSRTFEISDLKISQPRGYVIQNKKDFNFDDLIVKYSSKKTPSKGKTRLKFNILNVKVIDGEFYYTENQTPIKYFIKSVNLESTGKKWDSSILNVIFSFSSGTDSGVAQGNLTIDLKKLDYELTAVVDKFDLSIVQQYLKDLSNFGSFSANLDADIKAKGNIMDEQNITLSGLLAINDFHFGKNEKEDYASFDKASVSIIELSPKNFIYVFDSVYVDHPYFKFEQYDSLNNLEAMFGKHGANIKSVNGNQDRFNLILEVARYVNVLAKNFFKSYFKVNRLSIQNGDLKFNDYSISEKFSIEMNPINISSDSIDKNNDRVDVSLNSGFKPYGDAAVNLSINPKDAGDFNLNYRFQNLPVSMFNPYFITYSSFPLDRGTLEFKGKWNVKNGIIDSENNLLILDPRETSRIKNKDTKWIPMPLVMSFIRSSGNVIDYEIPISGDLKNPKFHLHDVIFGVLENIFVKPLSIPYTTKVDNVETDIEKSIKLKWATGQSILTNKQEEFVQKMADFLYEFPEARISVSSEQFEQKEKEYILFFEAKKKYFLQANNRKDEGMDNSEYEKVYKMSVRNTLFTNYLNAQVQDSMLFTIQDKCMRLIGPKVVNAQYKLLNMKREKAFLYFFQKKALTNRISFNTPKNTTPYNGFSNYRIVYKGEYPEALITAYKELNKINSEPPRDQFEKERNQIKKGI